MARSRRSTTLGYRTMSRDDGGVLILGGLAVLDLLVVGAMIGDRLPLSLGATLHAGCVLAGLFQSIRSRAPIASVVAAAFGPWATLLAYPLTRVFGPIRRRAVPVNRVIGPTTREAADRRLTDRIADDRLRSPDAGQILRFADILRSGDIRARQQVVTTVVRNFDPRLSPLIATALTDADQSIRTQAAATVAEVEQALTRRRTELAGRPGRGAAWGLSGLLLEHATHNVVLSDSNRLGLRIEALAILQRLSSTLTPGDPEFPAVKRRHAAVLLALNRGTEAAAVFGPTAQPILTDATSLTLLIDALVAARDYDRLADMAAEFAGRPEPLDEALATRLAFWRRSVAA